MRLFLSSAINGASPQTNVPILVNYLKRKMRSEQIKELQKNSRVKPDGIFGPATFKAACKYLELPNELAGIHFFAQCEHETGGFSRFEENLNYGSQGLQTVFKKYFPDQATADAYARKPEKIANRVYANRMGNGDEASGDGWKFRGRGAIQLTGRSNYEAFAKDFEMPWVIEDPDSLITDLAFPVGVWFFWKNNIFDLCIDTSDATIKKITRRINGGYNGLEHRTQLTRKYESYLI